MCQEGCVEGWHQGEVAQHARGKATCSGCVQAARQPRATPAADTGQKGLVTLSNNLRSITSVLCSGSILRFRTDRPCMHQQSGVPCLASWSEVAGMQQQACNWVASGAHASLAGRHGALQDARGGRGEAGDGAQRPAGHVPHQRGRAGAQARHKLKHRQNNCCQCPGLHGAKAMLLTAGGCTSDCA